MNYTGDKNFNNSINVTSVYCIYLNIIVPCYIFDFEPDKLLDFLIFYLFRIFLNEANKCSHASGDMGLSH